MAKTGPKARPPLERVMARVAKTETGCWQHEAPREDGYARVLVGSRSDGSRRVRVAHRVVYESLVGPVPEGMDLDHLCRNRACVNPDHLEPVSRGINLHRGETIPAAKAAQTHCINGHEFDERNTGIRPNGTRWCKACKVETVRRWKERNPEKVAQQRARERKNR